MAEMKKVPAIRFKGFSDEWFITKFETITKINQGLQIAISQRYTEKVEGSHFYITNEFLKENANLKYYILNPPESVLCNRDDVLMTRTGNTGEVVTDISGAFHNNFFKIKYDTDKIKKNFLVTFLKLSKTQKIILASAGSSTIPDLNHSAFYNIEITFPENEKEQTQIGSYFQHLDKLISLHQTKVNKLTNLKKAMLEKMFPKQGADVPEIRFKGFAGAWEERPIESIFNYERPDNYIVKSIEYSDEHSTPVLTANKAFILGYTNETRTFNEPSIIFDDFTLDFKYVDFSYMVKSSALKILTIKDIQRDNLIFALNLLNSTKFETMGHARHYISVVQLKNVRVPKIDEQEKIANYFHNLDKTINLHQTVLEKLNNLKKACLEKMFV